MESLSERAAGILYRYFFTEPPRLPRTAGCARHPRRGVWETMLRWGREDLLDLYFEDAR